MPWLIPVAAAAVGAGATLLASNNASDAADRASQAQQQGQQAAIGEQQREFDTNQTNLKPWLTAGQAALGQQMALLGLGSPTGATGGATPQAGGYNVQKILSDPNYADVVQWAQNGGGDPNTPIGQQSIADRVNYWIKNGQSMGDPRAVNAPTYSPADVTAQGPGAQQQAAIDALKGSPLYQSLYRNGQNAILSNASATGGLRGGNINASLANFGSDTLASVIQQQLSNLGGISGQGMNTGTNLGQLNGATSGNISQLLTQQGGANAGGILASAGIGNGGLMSALSQLTNGIGQSYSAYRAGQSPSLPYTGATGVQPFDPINGLF